jgi:hypothetical protein
LLPLASWTIRGILEDTLRQSMNYICSINKKVASHLDKNTGKIPTGGNFTAFNENWKPVCISISDLAQEIGRSTGLCAWHLIEGKRQRNNTGLIQAGMIIVDIDNQADGKDAAGDKIQKQELTFEQALELDLCSQCGGTGTKRFGFANRPLSFEWGASGGPFLHNGCCI